VTVRLFPRWVIFIILPGGVGIFIILPGGGGLYSLFYPVGYINYLLHITPGEERARVGGG
jgi:hypothetical protein